MASRAPPIPPAQRSSQGDKSHAQGDGLHRGGPRNLKEKGHAGSVHQNTHHSHQQDR